MALRKDSKDVTDARKQWDARFFQPNLPPERIPETFRALLEEYSRIPRSDQVSHIVKIRNQAYEQHPYPCLGRFRFLDLDLTLHPLYHDYVLPTLRGDTSESHIEGGVTLKDGVKPIFLDLGTCLGQDLRKLIHDGAPVDQLYGADLDTAFLDISYALFKDQHIFPQSQFLLGQGSDVLADEVLENDRGLSQLVGQVDILNATAIFHLFDLDKQKKIARLCLHLLRGSSAGMDTQKSKCLILGGQAGHIDAREITRSDSKRRFRHNVESWRDMWETVAAEDEWQAKGIHIDVWSELRVRGWIGGGDDPSLSGQQLAEGDGKNQWNSNVVGSAAEGSRWHVYSVWVTFGK